MSIAAPTNLQAHAGYPAVTLTWDAAAGAQEYNLCLATQPGVSPTNGNLLMDGEVIRDVKSDQIGDEKKRVFKISDKLVVRTKHITQTVNGIKRL